jgi:asparagine synthase (glutamine-hydrolysing)
MSPVESAAYPSMAFLAISHAPRTQRSLGVNERRAYAAAADLSYAGSGRSIGRGTSIWLGSAGREDAIIESRAHFTVLLSRSPRPVMSAQEIGHLLPDGMQDRLCLDQAATDVLAVLTPPFGVVSCRGEGYPVVAATDCLGYRHIYHYQGDGWAGISTSSLALAYCANSKLDLESLAARSLLGFHLGESTPFSRLRKLGPGGICALADGKVRLGCYREHDSLIRAQSQLDLTEQAREVAKLLREIVREHVEQHSDLVLQLSGGLDSRIQLAAIPPGLRPRLRSLTLSQRGSADVSIARRLAEANELDHQEFSLDPIADLNPEVAHVLVQKAAVRHGCSADPIAQAVLDWSEGQLGEEPRIHGAGGEVARGFYYPGQRQHQRGNPALVDRLAKWRLFTNEAVDPACMGQSRADWARESTLIQLRKIFSQYDTDWLSATDAFYLGERMARWAGIRLSVASTERTLLGSLTHPKFIALAQECPPEYKRGSRLMARVLQELDPELARLPLDSGYIPAELAGANFTARLRSYRVTARKVISKGRQQMSHTRRPARGASLLSERVLEYWRSQPGILDGLTHLDIIDEDWLSELLAGRCTANASTVGFLASLYAIAEAIEKGSLTW